MRNEKVNPPVKNKEITIENTMNQQIKKKLLESAPKLTPFAFMKNNPKGAFSQNYRGFFVTHGIPGADIQNDIHSSKPVGFDQTQVYEAFSNDMRNLINEFDSIEQEIFKGLDTKTIDSIQKIEKPTDIVKMWYMEYLVNEKSPSEISPELKDTFSQKMTDIIFDNSYQIDFISDMRGDTVYYDPQYNLLKQAYFACLSYNKKMATSSGQDPNLLSFSQFKQLLVSKMTKSEVKMNSLNTILSHGINPQQKTVDGIQDALRTMLREMKTNDYNEIKNVRNALDEVWAYKSLKFTGDSNPYDALFYNFYVIAYHLGTMIPRTVGFDIRHFVPLSDDIFVAGKKDLKYTRHHFRALIATVRKGSSDINDLILTDGKLHKSYEKYVKTQAGEAKIQGLLDGFIELINIEGEITREKIMEVVDSEFYTIWFNNRYFDDNLAEFNERKSFIKKYGNQLFILKYYTKTYKNYFGFVKNKEDFTSTYEETYDTGYEKLKYLGDL